MRRFLHAPTVLGFRSSLSYQILLPSLGISRTHILTYSTSPSQTAPKKAPKKASGPEEPSNVVKVSTGAASASFTAMATLTSFHFVVCPVSPTIFFSCFVAAVFSGAFAAFESGSKEGASGTTFGCVIGMVMGMIAGYFAKLQQEPWR